MKIPEKPDYSFLFNNNNSSAGSSANIFNSIDLSEYNSIKTGTYGKLLKSYYAQMDDDSSKEVKDTDNKKKTTASEDSASKKLTEVSTNASSLADSAEKLITKGSNSLFRNKEVDSIYNAVNDFADKYNSFLKSMKNSDSDKVEKEISGLTNLVSGYKNSLQEVGISIQDDNTFSVDEQAFKASDMDKVKNLFNGNTSFTYVVSTKASIIGTTANNEANAMKNYTSAGNYDKSFSTGNLLDSLI